MESKTSDIKLQGLLLAGDDIEYEGILIRNYSLGDIFKKIKLDKYYFLIGLTVVTVQDLVEGTSNDISKLKIYDVFRAYPQYNQAFIEFLNTFTYLKWENGLMDDYVAYDNDNKRYRINENKFDGLMQIIKKIYVVSKGKAEDKLDIDLATSNEAKELAMEFIEFEKENSNKEKSGITLMGIINGLCSKGIGYNLFNIWDLKMYQLISVYYGVEQVDNYDYIMQSIYHGVWDTKKNKINFNNIHWCKEVNI